MQEMCEDAMQDTLDLAYERIKALRKGYPNCGAPTLAYNTAIGDAMAVIEGMGGGKRRRENGQFGVGA